MKIYKVLYLAEHDVAERFAKATPEQAAQGLAAWQAWGARAGQASDDTSGIVDMGLPLSQPVDITQDGDDVTVNKKSDCKVIGLSVIQAEDMDAAIKMMDGHPHLMFGTITILEQMPIPELQNA